MINIFYRNLRKKKLKKLPKFKEGSWLYIENPTKEELEYLSQNFPLDKGLLSDGLDPYEVPRMEKQDGVNYIFSRAPYYEGKGEISTTPFLVAVGKNFVLTLSEKHLPFLDKFLEEKTNFYTTQKSKFLIQVFSSLNSHYSKLLNTISRDIRAAKSKIAKINNKQIVQFVNFEEILNDFLGALTPTNTILRKLLEGGFLKFYKEDKELIEDLLLQNGELIETCNFTVKNINNIRESYSTIMSQNLNQVIKLLTTLTVVLTIPTIVASLYGMNVNLPFQQHPLAFWGIITVILFLTVVLLLIFNKKNFL